MLGLTAASGGDIQDDGLVLTHFGEVPAAWDCSGLACSPAIVLPSAGFFWVRAFDINDQGDVVGEGMLAGTSEFRAVIWRFNGLAAPSPWSEPLLLPDFGSPSGAYASEWIGGTLTVVGAARRARKVLAVRWRSNGTTWSAPEKIDDLDDSSTVPTVPDHMSATGRFGGTNDAETPR